MKFPFVPRSIYDETVADLRAQLTDERNRTRRLTRTIVKMKVAGGSIPRVLNGLRLEPKTPSPIEIALDENPRTRVDMKLRARHRAWADRELAQDPDALPRVLAKLKAFGTVTAKDLEDDDDDDQDDDDVIEVSA